MAWLRPHQRRSIRKAAIDVKVAGIVVLVLLLALAGWMQWTGHRLGGERPAGSVATHDEAWFVEEAASAGLDFIHVSGRPPQHYFPEIMVGGVCLLDYDGNGLLDVYAVQSGDLDPKVGNPPGNKLYRNRTAPDQGLSFEDVSAQAGVGDAGYGAGCACGDYDRDGDVDLYVTNVGPNVLYRNNGDGTFSDVTEQAGVGDPAWSQSAAFVDYDADGLADLMVVNYVRWSIRSDRQCFSAADVRGYCGPSNYQAPMPDTLYHNEGQGHFADVSASAGLGAAFGNGLGVACGDYNNDGLTDIYVANDGMPNQLWLNQGQGKFLDEALLTGCAVNMQGASEAGMGVAAVDADHDGDLDLFMSHIRGESNTFYVNQGGWFEDTTARMGLGAASVDFTGFGLGFADFDHDGLLDLYLVNGRVNFFEPAFDGDDVFAEPNQLFAGRGESQFEEVMPRGGTLPELIATSRGTAFGDLDNDGDTDVVVINKDGPVHLLRNVRGEQGHWIIFRVLNDTGGYALDAVVKLEAAGQVQMRRVQRAYSYGASNDPRVHFGLGTAKTVDRVTVRWIDGGQAEFGPFEAGQIHDLRRQDGDSK